MDIKEEFNMNKFFKKITAAAIAASLTIGAMSTVTMAAPVSEDTWSVLYYNHSGTGTYTGEKDSCYMTYSSKGNYVACKGIDCTADGATGSAYVHTVGSNVTSVSYTFTYTGETKTLVPKALGEVIGVTYEFYGSTGVVGNTVTSHGSIKTNK